MKSVCAAADTTSARTSLGLRRGRRIVGSGAQHRLGVEAHVFEERGKQRFARFQGLFVRL